MSSEANFPVECLEAIFQHMNPRELLTCSLVCPDWNEFIGATRSCMKKIKFTLPWCISRDGLDKIAKNLAKSERKYESAWLEQFHVEELREILTINGRKWKQVNSLIHFETDSNFKEFLAIFQTSVENLVLNGGKVKHVGDYETTDLHFPNLKALALNVDCALLYGTGFANCRNLETLKIAYGLFKMPSACINAIRSGLKVNNGLKKLTISSTESLFSDDFSNEINFKLKELDLMVTSLMRNHQLLKVQKNLNLFLKTQKDSLEVLRLEGWWLGVEVMQTILSMTRLKTLFLGTYGFEMPMTENFPKNHSVTCLSFSDYWTNVAVFSFLLELFPNIKSLRLPVMSRGIAETIRKKCKSLKILSVDCFSAEKLSKDYNLALNMLTEMR